MNIDNGTSESLVEDTAVVIKIQGRIVEKGSNYVTVLTEDDDEIDITDSSTWFIELI